MKNKVQYPSGSKVEKLWIFCIEMLISEKSSEIFQISGPIGGDHFEHLGNQVQDPRPRCQSSSFIGPGPSFSVDDYDYGFGDDSYDDASEWLIWRPRL